MQKWRQAGATAALLPFHAITPFTMLDYPGLCACILWVAGCNMRCRYCHNPEVVLGKGTIGEDEAIGFLGRRQGLLDGVVLSGGEATTWPGLADFAARVKAMGYAVKLDTNGLRPDVVALLLDEGLVDRIALDYKAPRVRFTEVTMTRGFARFIKTLDLLCAQDRVPFEVRSTLHTGLLGEDDVLTMARDLAARRYRGTYAVQRAVIDPDRPTLGQMAVETRLPDIARLEAESPIELVFR